MIYLKCLSGTQSAVTLWSGCWRTKQAPKLTNILKMRVYNDRDCPHWHVLDCCREQQRAEHESRESNWAVFKFMTRLMHSERRPRSLSHCQCVFGFFFPWNSILIALISAVKGDRTHTPVPEYTLTHRHISMSPECEGLRCTVIPKWWIQYFCNPPWIKAESWDWIWTEIPCSGVQRQSEEEKCHCPKTYTPNCNNLATERLHFQQHLC